VTTTVNAYGVSEAGQPLGAVAVDRRDVGRHDVKLDILFCVTEIGSEVTKHKVGDRVGIGCMVDSCRECANCRRGAEQYCVPGHTLVFGNVDRDGSITQGGYSQAIMANEDFVVHVPESLDPAAAAPLLCAGITTYAPLKRWGAGPGTQVAVVGLGGLGHLGVKIAKAMGAEVTVLSRSEAKHEAATALGADHYHVTRDPEIFKTMANTFDIVLNTVSAPIDLDAYLGLLALRGTLVSVGVTTEPMSLNVFSLLGNERNYTGSQFGSIRETQEMLDFCAEHDVTADIELIRADQINDAYERVLASDVRYRFVIDTATLA
jgi:uncharacterized zinc-type alcohol dehydrogenase-like protein